jgi:hypothetical protein
VRRYLIVIALGSGCLFPSLDGLTGGAAPDASMDVAIKDGPPSGDAGRFCDGVSPTPAFCEDFDQPTPPDVTAWTGFTQTGGGKLSVDATYALSSPRSLLTEAPAISSGSGEAAAFPSLGPAPSSSAKLSFDVSLTPGDNSVAVAGFVSNATNVYVVVGPSGIHLGEGAYSAAPMYPSHPTYPVTWAKGWTHIDVTLKRAGSAATTSLSVDGTVLETDFACDSRFTWGALQVGLGYFYIGSPSAARQAHLDNIVAYDQ